MHSTGKLPARAALAAGLLLCGSLASDAGTQAAPGTGGTASLHQAATTRFADPKLDGSFVEIGWRLDPQHEPWTVAVTVTEDATGQIVKTVWQGRDRGSLTDRLRRWDGRDDSGAWVDPGSYTIWVEARSPAQTIQRIRYPLDVCRFGIVSLAAQSTATTGTNEWQTVYFMKNGNYNFYATPDTAEFVSKADTGQVSDLDLDDGSPRPAPAVHTATDEPVLELGSGGTGWKYDNDWFNYPVCYVVGSIPQLEAKFGATCTSSNGTQGSVGYPIPGFEFRCVARDDVGAWSSSNTNIAPNGTATFTGPALPAEAGRVDRALEWRWQWRETGATGWNAIPGRYETTIRFYTNIDQPYWANGASGTQYTGPWVEVLEYLHSWKTQLGVTTDSTDRVVEAFIKGFFGQNGTITTAIEDVHYDCPSEGGDGGATHYFDWGTWTMHLTQLLNAHDNGEFVNCTDCAGSTSTMLSMLGVAGYKMDHLGSMTLRAIWGIGTDDYTLDLWGGSHGFSYHHIITRDGGTTISDACLWVDEDGNPDALPGTPGFNNDRDWNNYEALLAKANVSWYTEKLGKID